MYVNKIQQSKKWFFLPRPSRIYSRNTDSSQHRTPTTLIHYINKLKGKIIWLLTVNAEKAFDKIQEPLLIITQCKTGTEETPKPVNNYQ
jgi:hypothetical protein